MNVLGCVIVDDEEFSIHHLQRLITRFDHLTVLATYTDPVKALNDINSGLVTPDLLFLDVEMQDITGIQFINLVQNPSILTVFCTGFPNFGSHAFETEAIDFLVKPVSIERFQRMLKRIAKVRQVNIALVKTSFYIETDKGRLISIPYNDVMYIKAEGNYIDIYTSDKHFLTHVTLADAEQFLNTASFIRVHRSYVINLDQIVSVDDDTIFLHNNHKVPISSGYKQAFLNRLDMLKKRR